MTTYRPIAVALSLVAACVLLGGCKEEKPPLPGPVDGAVVTVSMVNLIATPGLYHDRTVRTAGVMRIEFEANAIYLHQEDHDRRVASNAIWLEFGTEVPIDQQRELSGQYVAVEGLFDDRRRGHMGKYAGTIHVKLLARWPITPTSTSD